MSRRILALILVLATLALFASARPARAQISVTGITCGENQSGGNNNYGYAATAGGETFFFLGLMNNALIGSITNNTPGSDPCTWSEVPNTGVSGYQDIWYCPNATAGPGGNAAVASTNTQIGGCFGVIEGISNLVIDQSANSTTTPASTTWSSPSVAGSVTAEVFIAVGGCENDIGSPFLIPQGGVTFSAPGQMASNGCGGCPCGTYISSATGSYGAGFQQSSSAGPNSASIVSFKSGGSPPTHAGFVWMP